jgi:hypothetical protein
VRIVTANVVGGGCSNGGGGIQQIMLRARSVIDDRGDVLKFADFLGRCLALDPGRRIDVAEAMEMP